MIGVKKKANKAKKCNLTSYNKVNVREDSLRLLQLPGMALVEHVVDAVGIDAHPAARGARQRRSPRYSTVVDAISLRYRHGVCAERCCQAKGL